MKAKRTFQLMLALFLVDFENFMIKVLWVMLVFSVATIFFLKESDAQAWLELTLLLFITMVLINFVVKLVKPRFMKKLRCELEEKK
jgi:hypothetical protein